TGSYTIHELEQRRIVDQALTEEDAAFISGASTAENAAPASSQESGEPVSPEQNL
ncbi:MAG: hypothetical protein H0X14_04245, partial [Acidobacteria bacterium]|nr:hypothetical protein [Acidobacteriota bacterium]